MIQVPSLSSCRALYRRDAPAMASMFFTAWHAARLTLSSGSSLANSPSRSAQTTNASWAGQSAGPPLGHPSRSKPEFIFGNLVEQLASVVLDPAGDSRDMEVRLEQHLRCVIPGCYSIVIVICHSF
ncbi:hypothetical protein JDV02_003138 [Purpureocillium takamizusanense]|uniref:Uncharacterized protein n=1 Tax=Purpureocillium takamizusanense TaxID=2060973 RepID=A0A9Q8V9F6_9HYPO|nr:uncharacterized protein JDV02_003138 [Purpureocillium takamizusanense]UNI16727.1 hypothetical protein JDV02_003138 [Purpureocillium takamizusanense]